jgi:hypothetical protein
MYIMLARMQQPVNEETPVFRSTIAFADAGFGLNDTVSPSDPTRYAIPNQKDLTTAKSSCDLKPLAY